MPVRAKRLDLIPPYLFGEIARLKAAARAEADAASDAPATSHTSAVASL